MTEPSAIDVRGHCYCGAVGFRVQMPADAKPIFTAYCHCDSCRRAHAAPLYHIVAVAEPMITFTGEEHIREFNRGGPTRAFCTECGSKVYNRFGAWRPGGMVPVGFFPNLLDEPSQHPLPERFRPQRMNRPDECVLDTAFLGQLDGLRAST